MVQQARRKISQGVAWYSHSMSCMWPASVVSILHAPHLLGGSRGSGGCPQELLPLSEEGDEDSESVLFHEGGCEEQVELSSHDA